MTADALALQRLVAWFSPAFPIGAFAYSAGLETAIAEGIVTTRGTLANWLAAGLGHGSPRADALLLAESFRAGTDAARLKHLSELAVALIPAPERRAETLALGSAFRIAAAAWPDSAAAPLPEDCAYPVALGAIAAAGGLPLPFVLIAFLTALAQTQISVAVRLVPLGQTDGLNVLSRLEPDIAAAAELAETGTLADLGTIGFAADIAAMGHETLETRIFRS
ncbi:MAG: urease accessory protein UreF [Alphaproteobacteria bacterium]|nr:urease accessory protein UreF [Alphaproteobacteria bacterium]